MGIIYFILKFVVLNIVVTPINLYFEDS